MAGIRSSLSIEGWDDLTPSPLSHRRGEVSEVEAGEIVECFAATHQARLPGSGGDHRRTRRKVVLAGHRQVISAADGDRQRLAGARLWQLHRAHQHIARLAVAPDDLRRLAGRL